VASSIAAVKKELNFSKKLEREIKFIVNRFNR